MNEPTGRVLILLCTYNEVENLPPLVAQLRESLPEADILVVDDGSPDGTGEWVAEARKLDPKLYLIERSGKLGLGTATRDGMAWCITRDYDYLIQMDADFSHRPQDVPRLLDACKKPDCDISVGTRYRGGGGFHGMPIHRRAMSWLLNHYAIWLLKLPVSDCSGSFRCYRVCVLKKIDLHRLRCEGYGFLEEILVYLNRAGGKIAEVPIQFDPRAKGSSKLGLSDAIGVIRVIHRLAFEA
jgi:dolichol-phosphate mannosyltransferase